MPNRSRNPYGRAIACGFGVIASWLGKTRRSGGMRQWWLFLARISQFPNRKRFNS
jgi:hypothetical protein